MTATLPKQDGQVQIPAQAHPAKPGERSLTVYVRYPGGKLERVTRSTGLMLSLHNWGGQEFSGAPDPAILTEEFNCIVIGVDYFQSGAEDSDLPYDHGWLQALDVLRALHFVITALDQEKVPFAADRIYAVGGSGGGYVSLMANKFAPRTFAAVVDISGPKELSDDVAFGLERGSDLNARYSTDEESPAFLSIDQQELRQLRHAGHLRAMKAWGNSAKIISVHGESDASCLFPEAQAYAESLVDSGLDFLFVPVTSADLDGVIFQDTGHGLGNRTAIALHVAGEYLTVQGPSARRLPGATDFARREVIRYQTTNGSWFIDYANGYPVGRYEAAPQP